MSSGGGKPGQLSAFGHEMPCETTANRKVTVKPFDNTHPAGDVLWILVKPGNVVP